MPVRVPFHLRRRPDPAAVAALLLGSDDPAVLLAACARLAEPTVFPVRGGFLVVADDVPAGCGGIRLRRLSENCYLPADADLVPALLPAEAIDLTARRGLVCLPGRDPLAFDPGRPLPPAAFLAVPKPRRDDWEPFPAGRPPADRLTAITRVLPVPPLDDLLGGGPPVGTEDARPPAVGPGRQALGRLAVGLGKGLGGIGQALGSKMLGNLGEKMKDLGTKAAPRLTEDLLGKQEAALRRLLQKFREGKTDDALRRAVPVGNEPGRGSRVYGSDELPRHRLSWSFASLFGWSGGVSSVWAGGSPDTWRDLIAAYRKAAQEAADRGDFRRAALIHAKLLSDFRAAGEVLSRGGLHREAGILFRDRVRAGARAAREFEQAGDPDEALRLYREAHLYLDAGDLLRRLGEEDLAVAEYHRAADRVVQLRQDHVEAGDILLKKTGRADLAGAYFARGWQTRDQSMSFSRNATACAGRLIEIYAFADPRDPFWELLGEAEDWLRAPGRGSEGGRFFNKVAGLAELPHLKADRGEILAHCRLGLADRLREHAKYEPGPGTAITDLFGSSGRWPTAVVSDAEFALKAAFKGRPKGPRPDDRAITQVLLHAGTVTAAVQAPASEDIFVGYEDGEVVHYDPEAGRGMRVAQRSIPVVGLTTDPVGDWVAVLWGDADPVHPSPTPTRTYVLELLARSPPGYEGRARTQFAAEPGSVCGLLPLFDETERGLAVGVSTTGGVTWYELPALIPRAETRPLAPLPPTTYLKLRIPSHGGEADSLTFQGGSVSWGGRRAYIGWMPDPGAAPALYTPPVAWLVSSPTRVHLAGLFDRGHLYFTEIDRGPDGSLTSKTWSHLAGGGYAAVAVWRPGKVVGVTAEGRVVWLRTSGELVEWARPTALPGPGRAAACFPARRAGELLVVMNDGTLARVPVPG